MTNPGRTVWDRAAAAIARWPGGVVAAAVLLTAGSVALGTRLRVDADLWKLLPPDYESYRALDRLRATVGGENPLDVVIQSPSFAANRAFADSLIPRALALQCDSAPAEPCFRTVSYRRDTAFLERNALYFATTDELDRLTRFLQDLKAEARRRANPFNHGSAAAERRLDAMADSLRASAAGLAVSEYPMSPDSTVMVVRLYPASSQADLQFVDVALQGLAGVVQRLAPAAYQPAMTVKLGGRFVQEHLEAEAIGRDGTRAALVGIPGVLLVVLLYFGHKIGLGVRGRRPTVRDAGRLALLTVLVSIPLGMSIAWTYGLAYVAFGTLNVVTTTIGLVLFGVGVDYGVHFFGVYADARTAGGDPAAALRATFATAGGATVAGAATTVAALFVLALADFRAFREFGVLTGTGIVLGLAAMLVVLPAMVVLADRRGLLFPPVTPAASRPGPSARGARPRGGVAWMVLLTGAAVTVLSLAGARHVQFEYDGSRLQPALTEYFAVQAAVSKVYPRDGRENPAYIVADRPDEVEPVLVALRERMRTDTLTPTIRAVEALQDRFPLTPGGQRARLEQLAAIRDLLNGAVLSRVASADLARLRRAAGTTQPIPLDQVPHQLSAPFLSRDGTAGNLVLVYPSVRLADGRAALAFAEDVGTVTTGAGRTYHAASMSLVVADMIHLMQRESVRMVTISLVVIVAVLLYTFRSFRWAAVALVPTAVGLLWMLGGMWAAGIKLNFFNLVALPVVLGVGDDAGVHLVEVFRAAPAGTRRAALWSAGERVVVASLTTVIGFVALMLTSHPGIRSIGTVAALGITTTLVAALVLVPPLLWLAARTPGPDRLAVPGALPAGERG